MHFSDIKRVSQQAPETSRLVLSLSCSVSNTETSQQYNKGEVSRALRHYNAEQAHREMSNSVLSAGLEKDVKR